MEENKEKVSLVENILNEEEDNINISEEVITTISGIAVSEISGVAEMAGGITGGITEVLSGKKNLSKGIKADVAGNNVKIDAKEVFPIPGRAAISSKSDLFRPEVNTPIRCTSLNIHRMRIKYYKYTEKV